MPPPTVVRPDHFTRDGTTGRLARPDGHQAIRRREINESTKMFSIEAYAAQRQVFTANESGGMTSEWEPCRVLGITKDEDGEPGYLVEFYSGRESMLAVESYVRRLKL